MKAITTGEIAFNLSENERADLKTAINVLSFIKSAFYGSRDDHYEDMTRVYNILSAIDIDKPISIEKEIEL